MALAKLLMLKFIFLICLCLYSAPIVLMDSGNAKKPNHVSSSRVGITKMLASGLDIPSGNFPAPGNGPPPDCGGGNGYYEAGPKTCCCEFCGFGLGPRKLPSEPHLDPRLDSCCEIGNGGSGSADQNTMWGCCNCPDGIWIETLRRAATVSTRDLFRKLPTQVMGDKVDNMAAEPITDGNAH